MPSLKTVKRVRLPIDTKEEYLIRLACPAGDPIIIPSKSFPKKKMV